MPMMPTAQWKEMRNKEIKSKIICGSLLTYCVAFGIGVPVIRMKIDAANADTWIKQEYIEIIEDKCEEKGLCPEFVEALIESESSGRTDVISSAGCVGLMQVSPKYSGYTESQLKDAETNIDAGTDILLELFEKYKDCYVVLMAYNEGEYGGAIERGERGNYSKYSEKIVKRAEQLERLHYK